MKKLLALFLLVSFAGCTTVPYVRTEAVKELDIQKYSRIAILPFGEDGLNLKNAISETFITEFLGMGFDVVERSQLNAVLKELKLNMSGAINNDEAKQLGKLLDIDALLLGSVVMRTVDSVYTLNLRFVDIRTGEILWSSSYLNVKEDIDKAISVIASSLHKKLFGNKIEKKSKVRIAKNRLFKGKEFKKIAILRLAGPDYISAEKTLRGLLTTYFIGEQVKLVERAALKNILNEQFLEGSGFFSAPTADEVVKSSNVPTQLYLSKNDLKKIGNLTGADGLLVGSFSPEFYYTNRVVAKLVNLRLLDIETGRIAYSISYYNYDARLSFDNIDSSAFFLTLGILPGIKGVEKDYYMGEVDSIYKRYHKGFKPASNLFTK